MQERAMERTKWFGWLAVGGIGLLTSVSKGQNAAAPPSPADRPVIVAPSEEPTYAISWPILMELAHASGIDVQLGEAKYQEAAANVSLAKSEWLPSLWVGTSYLHHDGAIQDIPGNVFNTNKNAVFLGPTVRFTLDPATIARDIKKAEGLARVRASETSRASRQHIHDVSQAFVDLQGAQAGIAIMAEAVKLLGDQVDRAQQFKTSGHLSDPDVRIFQNILESRDPDAEKLEEQHRAAGIRLAGMLRIDQAPKLYAAEEQIALLDFVDVNAPDGEVVETAMRNGPGIDELDHVLRGLQEQLEIARSMRWVPSINADFTTGGFGGGQAPDFSGLNQRFDASVNVGYDLSNIFRGDASRRAYQATKRYHELNREKVREKIATGAMAALAQARSARKRIDMTAPHIKKLDAQYQHVRKQERELLPPDAKDIPPFLLTIFNQEVNTIGQLAAARKAYLEALLDYNRAQVTLHFLTHRNNGCGVNEDNGVPLRPAPGQPPAVAPTSSTAAPTPTAQPVRGGSGALRQKGFFPAPRADDRIQ
jgi:outer membrane protein TolC